MDRRHIAAEHSEFTGFLTLVSIRPEFVDALRRTILEARFTPPPECSSPDFVSQKLKVA